MTTRSENRMDLIASMLGKIFLVHILLITKPAEYYFDRDIFGFLKKEKRKKKKHKCILLDV